MTSGIPVRRSNGSSLARCCLEIARTTALDAFALFERVFGLLDCPDQRDDVRRGGGTYRRRSSKGGKVLEALVSLNRSFYCRNCRKLEVVAPWSHLLLDERCARCERMCGHE